MIGLFELGYYSIMYNYVIRGKPLRDFDYTRTVSAANEASVLYSVVEAIRGQLDRYPNTEEEDAAIIKDKALFRLLSYNQRMAVRHRRNEKRLLKRTIAALEKQIRTRGLDAKNLSRAEGSTLGQGKYKSNCFMLSYQSMYFLYFT